MKVCKKNAVLGLVLASTLGSAIVPSTSHATFGLLYLNAVLILDGLVLTSYGASIHHPIAPTLLLMGLILLDGENGRSYAFGPVNAEQAAQIGLTAEEHASYNASIDELNAARDAVAAELSSKTQPTSADSAAAWEKYDAGIDPQAVNAAKKVVTHAFKK